MRRVKQSQTQIGTGNANRGLGSGGECGLCETGSFEGVKMQK